MKIFKEIQPGPPTALGVRAGAAAPGACGFREQARGV